METSMETLPKKRGRPKGVKNGQGSHVLAPIVDWTPFCETVVQLSLANISNIAIAEQFGYTPIRISQILQDPRAKATKAKILRMMSQQYEESITGRLTQLADHAITNITATICTPTQVGSRAKIHQDNISMKLLEGFIPQGRVDSGKGRAENMEPRLVDRLISALEKSNEVAEMATNRPVDAEIVIEENKDA